MNYAPATRYRYGARKDDPEAVAAHAQQSREWRRAIADAEFGALTRSAFLAALGECGDVVSAASAVGVTHNMVYGRMRWDDEFRTAVEKVLETTCQARVNGRCGTAQGYKLGGRCQACRASHH